MKNGFKLWLLIFVIIVILGVVVLVHGSPLTLEKKDGSYVKTSENTTALTTVGEDFHHFITIIKDIFHASRGEETVYESGYDAILGKEEYKEPEKEEQSELADTDEETDKPHQTLSDRISGQADENTGSNPVTLTKVKLERVIDGDTLEVSLDDVSLTIRLIGIDTPESVHSDASRNTIWGTYASDYTKMLLENTEYLYLEYDVEPEDKYGRTLAYVWLSEDTTDLSNMLNAILLQDGYAYDKVYKPNEKYKGEFEKYRITAQENGTGLWADEGFAALWEG